jgi:molybdopterin synthase sulfur carrier subunit
MPKVKFTKNLQRFIPDLESVHVEGGTVAEVVQALEQHFPGLAGYLVDDQGALREHVNIFVNQELIQDPQALNDRVEADDQVYVLQALSGG